MTLLPYKKQYRDAMQEYNLDTKHITQAERLDVKEKAQKELKKKMMGRNDKINWWKILMNLGYIIAQVVVQWLADKLEDKPLEV